MIWGPYCTTWDVVHVSQLDDLPVCCIRIPALTDHTAGELPVFESGAIMWYVAAKDSEHKLFPKVRQCTS